MMNFVSQYVQNSFVNLICLHKMTITQQLSNNDSKTAQKGQQIAEHIVTP